MDNFPNFGTFYQAINDRDPFPWQQRLADQVAHRSWPRSIGVGTGLGKTSCIDVAVWAMAAEYQKLACARISPTRIWYVVNRRLLVDMAFDHGCHIAHLLSNPDDAGGAGPRAAIASVAAALFARQGGAGADPLHVCRLRGGAELGARPPDPVQPSLIFATVPMFASRWMFRGFGTSANMRPVDAALAGIDTLVLLDEAHLSRPLMDLAESLAQCDIGEANRVISEQRSRPAVVSLTATGDDATFGLDDDDMAHPIVRQRLDAAKPLVLVEVAKGALVKTLADQAVHLLEGRLPSAEVVFANKPSTARAVFQELLKATLRRVNPLNAKLVLLTGRMREREAAGVRAQILDPATGVPAGHARPLALPSHLIVVATQTLEVGADLDFDLLVTEACGARALIQRLGRLNRLGHIEDSASAIVFPEGEENFGIYGGEPLEVWKRLRSQAVHGEVNMSPRVVAEVVGPPEDKPERVGELLPAHLWEWAKTTTPPRGEAPPEAFFSGFNPGGESVSVVWRAILPDDSVALRPGVTADEAIDLPIWELREALVDLETDVVARLRPDRVTIERDVAIARLHPGDVVILSSSTGGYDAHGWSPGGRNEVVLDVSLFRPPGPYILPSALRQIYAVGKYLDEAEKIAPLLRAPPEADEALDRARLTEQLAECLRLAGPSDSVTHEEWDLFQSRLTGMVVYLPGEPAGRMEVRTSHGYGQKVELRSDGFDELSFVASSTDLAEHLGSVGELAGRLAERLGIGSELVGAVAAAGRFHDLGKADRRFHRWLDPTGQSSQPIAKSSTPPERWLRDRIASGWPAGGRHEELSRRLVDAYLAQQPHPPWDPDLVLHLVVTHHGYGRPLLAGVADDFPTALCAPVDGEHVCVSGNLAIVDWEQPARFRRCCERYGYWGLALLEALVRQADHQVSSVVVA